jgi:hypothetical protein
MTPTSRIVTRFTQDINASECSYSILFILGKFSLLVDNVIPQWLKNFLDQTMKITLKLTTIVLFTPLFLIPGIAALALGYVCSQIYLKAQMSVKREMSVLKAPVLGQ